MTFSLEDFVTESNRIEGLGPAKPHEIAAHERLLAAPVLTVNVLQAFVWEVAHAPLREITGMNVRVGDHRPPEGGPFVREALQGVLHSEQWGSAYRQHAAYETLHPFMDGNGRSGRAVWLHAMGGIDRAPLGFLHHWYYQSLSEYRHVAG
jgi:hypothetical protein